MTPVTLNFDRLLKLRLIVARFGEMDLAKWWNTRGQLGRLGTAAIRRGFPRTHYFAQARSVFAVAAYRCREIFDPPNSVTLWRLPETIEEEFEARWEHWLDHANEWNPFFQRLESLQENDLKIALHAFDAVTNRRIRIVFATSPLGRRACCATIRTVLRHRSGHRIARSRIARGESQAHSRSPTHGGNRMTSSSRSHVASSFTLIKGAMIDETYAVFAAWDFARSKRENLDRLRQ